MSNYWQSPQLVQKSLVIVLCFLLIVSLYMSGQKVYSQSPITPPITPPDATPTPTPEPGDDSEPEDDSTSTSDSSSTSTGDTTDHNSAGEAPVCSDPAPIGLPELFQINVTSNSAVLYFTPVSDRVSYYYVAFGHSQDNIRFGGFFPSEKNKGVVIYKIDHLVPNTEYFFTVRAGNGCTPGEWSNWLPVRTTNSEYYNQSFYLYE